MTLFAFDDPCRRRLLGALAAGLLLVAAVVSSPAQAQAPSPNYSGDFLTRSTMTGDWGGVRNGLANKGVTFDIFVTQTLQGVVNGGTKSGGEYGGRGDMIITVDTGKLGLWPGGYFTAEVEGNWGKGANLNSGALMPVDTNQLFPIPGKTGEVAVPAFNYVQFLSKNFGVLVGKIDPTSSDQNEFAHGKYGKGDTQFMNLAFNFNPLTLVTVPYTPLGAGVLILPTGNPKEATIEMAALTSTGTANAAGFNNVQSDDLTLWGEGRVRTDFFGMTGHQLIGVLYSNKQFISLDQRLTTGWASSAGSVPRMVIPTLCSTSTALVLVAKVSSRADPMIGSESAGTT